MSKAYDRVEWNFLEKTMRAFGFSEVWITWVMATVRTVSYSVLINGNPQGCITPERGLRQGDPLSPYLFILCADVMSHLINVKARQGKIKGIKIGNGVPRITHLLFADDSLFFCQANRINCQAIKEVFEVYEMCSGQMINQSKSVITFGSRVYGQTQQRLKKILGINNQGGGGKYLGLPEQFGRKKGEMFKYILEKVRQRTATWSTKYLSPAGKEIMLKSVAMAMPVYSMSCFKLPKEVISELDSIMLKFWWEKGEHQRGIPWVAWKKLQMSKKDGGLGFRNLEQFNDALLAKQAWRLLKYPDSLFAKIYKARYYKDDDVFEARPHRYQSYGWSSILCGINLLQKGCRFLIGDGKKTRVYKDAWLPTAPPRPATPITEDFNIQVNDLIMKRGSYRTWNSTMLDFVLTEEDKALVERIHLSQQEDVDDVVWDLTPHGNYSVTTGYHLARTLYTDQHIPIVPPRGDPLLKIQVWHLPIMPKIKHFLWRILSKAIGTATRLNTRGVKMDKQCQRCCNQEESLNHLFFTCPLSLQTWRSSQLPYLYRHTPSASLEENLKFFLDLQADNQLTVVQKILPFWILWRIWKSRNNLLFNKVRINPRNDIDLSLSEAKSWITNNKPPVNENTTNIARHWIRPLDDWLKCNFDASFNLLTNTAYGGWIVRDKMGMSKFWGTSNLKFTNSPLEAETKALLVAMQMMWCKGYKKIIFEGDCQVLINLLNRDHVDITVHNLCKDINEWKKKFDEIRFVHVLRRNNEVAHVLSRHKPSNNLFFSDCIYPPYWLTNQLYQDYIHSR